MEETRGIMQEERSQTQKATSYLKFYLNDPLEKGKVIGKEIS